MYLFLIKGLVSSVQSIELMINLKELKPIQKIKYRSTVVSKMVQMSRPQPILRPVLNRPNWVFPDGGDADKI